MRQGETETTSCVVPNIQSHTLTHTTQIPMHSPIACMCVRTSGDGRRMYLLLGGDATGTYIKHSKLDYWLREYNLTWFNAHNRMRCQYIRTI